MVTEYTASTDAIVWDTFVAGQRFHEARNQLYTFQHIDHLQNTSDRYFIGN